MQAQTQVIQFKDEELGQETVLPKVPGKQVLRYKTVPLANRIEILAGYGFNFNEPIYNPSKIVAGVGYSWSDFSGVTVQYTRWNSGRNSQYSGQLEGPGINLKLDRIPNIESSLFLNYEMRAYYGKISLTKNSVMNMSFYPLLGAGMTKYTHKSYLGANLGAGWKFYFTKYLALRTDFYLQMAQAPNPFSPGDKLAATVNAVETSDFTDKWRLGTHFDLNVSVFF